LNFTPNDIFRIGEEVEVTLTTGLTSREGEPLEEPVVYRFRVEVIGGSEVFDQFPVPFSPVQVGTSPRSVSVGDWDGDGDLDLAATTAGDNIRLLFNNGSGLLSEDPLKSPVSGVFGPQSIIAGDLDNDGDLDLAVGNAGTTNVSIFINDGTGGFTQSLPPDSPVEVGTTPQTVIVGDWDGDGDLDLAVTTAGDRVRVLFNDGSGVFSTSSEVSGVVGPRSVIAGDWDRDGDLDLAVGNSGATNVSLLINDGAGGFSQPLPPASPVQVGTSPRSVTAGDWDGDGDLDLAATTAGDNVRLLFYDAVNDLFLEDPLKSPISGLVGPTSIVAGDWDGDGDFDLGVGNSGATNVSILINNGTGTFAQPLPPISPVEVGNTPQGNPQSMTAGDWDGDGDLDLAVGRTDTNVTLLENTP
jgi:hypothetical protein